MTWEPAPDLLSHDALQPRRICRGGSEGATRRIPTPIRNYPILGTIMSERNATVIRPRFLVLRAVLGNGSTPLVKFLIVAPLKMVGGQGYSGRKRANEGGGRGVPQSPPTCGRRSALASHPQAKSRGKLDATGDPAGPSGTEQQSGSSKNLESGDCAMTRTKRTTRLCRNHAAIA